MSLFDPISVFIICSCAVDGRWSDFGDWSECSAKCGGGIMTRRRTCTNPPPSNGGADCVGDNLEAKSCNTNSCSGNNLGARLSYNTTNADILFLVLWSFFIQPHSCGDNSHMSDISWLRQYTQINMYHLGHDNIQMIEKETALSMYALLIKN